MATFHCLNQLPSARAFVQLARLHCPSAHLRPAGASILEVLLPRWRPCSVHQRAYSSKVPTRTSVLDKRGKAAFVVARSRGRTRAGEQIVRRFTASASRMQTACVYNSQTDEDGKEMILEITDRAGKRLSQIMKKDSNPNLALRIQVESGGCHGFQYLMSLITLPLTDEHQTDWSTVVGEDDSIFQYAADAEPIAPTPVAGQPKIVIDQPSLDLLKGSKVDFTMELIGSQFKITDNPYATSSCGCGTSFDIKM